MNKLYPILIALSVGVIVWLWNKPVEVVEVTSENVLRDSIFVYDTVIKQTERIIIQKESNNAELENRINYLTLLLDSAKQRGDTVKIIEIQDTTINTLKQSNDTLKSIISLKDTVIHNKDLIIESQDTIIVIKNSKIKKFKRQRNVLGVVAVVIGGIAVFK